MKSMGKALSSTAKNPPPPTTSHAEIAEWLGGRMPALQPIVKQIDELIRRTVPGVHYAIKWNRAYYGSTKTGWMIELAPYDVSVNVVFFGGADFDVAPPLGTTGRTRYVKLTTLAEAKSPELRAWVKQAARVRGWK
jgi:hypothetical protein